jgi:hypothetical protein
LNHNAISSKDRSSMFDGRILTKPDEQLGVELVEWLNRSTVEQPKRSPVIGPQSASQPQPQPASPNPPLFDNNGHKLGEKETEAMLFAIQQATTVERLFSIGQSMSKGLSSKKITAEQAEKVTQAIQERSTQLAQQKAA